MGPGFLFRCRCAVPALSACPPPGSARHYRPNVLPLTRRALLILVCEPGSTRYEFDLFSPPAPLGLAYLPPCLPLCSMSQLVCPLHPLGRVATLNTRSWAEVLRTRTRPLRRRRFKTCPSVNRGG